MTRLRGRRRITCTECGKNTTTAPATTLCAECRDRARPHTPINIGMMPKSALDDWLKSGGAR